MANLALIDFQEQLELRAGKKLKIKINNNRSTMLSVRWETGQTQVSLHHMFLKAPTPIMDALGFYIKRKGGRLAPIVHEYIDQNLRLMDYSHLIDIRQMNQRGNVYDLKLLYDQINSTYFDQQLNLFITWYGEINRKRKSSTITFGLYQDTLKLIKIHRRLDNIKVPEYVISYVIYHEMLHAVCPSAVSKNGKRCIHTQAFYQREKLFREYPKAQEWIEENRECLFKVS